MDCGTCDISHRSRNDVFCVRGSGYRADGVEPRPYAGHGVRWGGPIGIGPYETERGVRCRDIKNCHGQ